MRTQWTTKGNRDAGSSCSCNQGLHQYLRNFGGGLNPPNPPPRYATVSTPLLPRPSYEQMSSSASHFQTPQSTCIIKQTNAHLFDSLSYCSLFIAPTCFNMNGYPQGAFTWCLLSYINVFMQSWWYFLRNECDSFLKNTTKTAWTRLCNLAGNKWELPGDDTLMLKHVGATNKEQYNKLSNKCAFVYFIIHIVKFKITSAYIPPSIEWPSFHTHTKQHAKL